MSSGKISKTGFETIERCRDLLNTEVAGKAMGAPRPFSSFNSNERRGLDSESKYSMHKKSPSAKLSNKGNRRLKLK